ncbi:MAG: type III secretion system export apparatus subunit SctT [Acidobacteria bacterium]|nr:type III secretion system export apparatus subunit SctT [Acidobacteriota bacterium]
MQEFLHLLELVLKTFEVGESPQAFLVLFGLSFARFISFITIVPFFGGQVVPSQVKVATAMALVIIVYPSLIAELPPGGAALGFGPIGFVGMLAKEVFVGFTLGFVASLAFEAVQVAGRLADLQRGSTMAELFAPQLQERVSELGQFQLQLAIVIFLTTGAHRFFIAGLVRSFEFIPALKFPHLEPGWSPAVEFMTQMTGGVLSLGIQLAVPIIITLLLTDLFFGLINRVAPQVNVFFLSMPVKMWIGIFVLLVMMPFLVERFRDYFDLSYQAFEFMIRSFGNAYR